MDRLWKILRRVLVDSTREFLSDEAPHRAAALAFYSLFSLVPLLVLVILAAGLVFRSAPARLELLEYVQSVGGQTARQGVARALSNLQDRLASQGSTAAVVFSIVGVLFGANAVFRNVLLSLNQVWDVPTQHHRKLWRFVRRRLFGFALTFAAGAVLLLAMALSLGLQVVQTWIEPLPHSNALWGLVDTIGSVVVSAVLVALVFRIVPDVELRWRHVVVGSFATAVLLEVGKWAVGLYLRHSRLDSIYGAAASVFVLLAWAYVSWIIFFWGAEFTYTLNRVRGRTIRAESGEEDADSHANQSPR